MADKKKSWLDTDRVERAGAWGMILLLLVICGTLVQQARFDIELGHAMQRFPVKPTDPVAFSFSWLYMIAMVLGIIALVRRNFSSMLCLIGSLATIGPVLIYLFLVEKFGFGMLMIRRFEEAMPIATLIAGLLLILPWLLPRLRWPARSVGNLALGVALVVFMSLQLAFHLSILLPMREIGYDMIDGMKVQISRTSAPEELARLATTGAIPLEPVDLDDPTPALAAARILEPEKQARAFRDIMDRKSPVLHVWESAGSDDVDRVVLVFDGRDPGAAQGWVLPPQAFFDLRFFAISAYYFLVGLGSFVWLGGAFLVQDGHRRLRAARAARNGSVPGEQSA